MIDVNLINGIALAFEGDAVYSMYIRRHLILKGMTKPNKLHQGNQRMCPLGSGSPDCHHAGARNPDGKELEIYKRGRNTNSHTKAKMRMW